jgi:hypothetical protein
VVDRVSRTPVVLGTLSIVFGSVMACWSVLGVLIGPWLLRLNAAVNPGMAAQNQATRAVMESTRSYDLGYSAVFALMSIALVFVGIGLIRRLAWARRAGIAWGWLAIAISVATFIVMVVWWQPHNEAARRAAWAAAGLQFQPSSSMETATAIVVLLVDLAFPIVLVAFLGRRSAVRDYRPPVLR